MESAQGVMPRWNLIERHSFNAKSKTINYHLDISSLGMPPPPPSIKLEQQEMQCFFPCPGYPPVPILPAHSTIICLLSCLSSWYQYHYSSLNKWSSLGITHEAIGVNHIKWVIDSLLHQFSLNWKLIGNDWITTMTALLLGPARISAAVYWLKQSTSLPHLMILQLSCSDITL